MNNPLINFLYKLFEVAILQNQYLKIRSDDSFCEYEKKIKLKKNGQSQQLKFFKY